MRPAAVVVPLTVAFAACAHGPSAQEANDALAILQQYRGWAWLVGIALVWADLFLPMPQTVVIAALGMLYGTALGGVLGSVALVTGGLLGYGLVFTSARRVLQRLVRERSMRRMEHLFERAGAWAIVLSRSLPYSIPEAIVLLAGLARMPLRRFTLALALGSVPTAFVFAAIGAGWAHRPVLAFALSYFLPVLLLPLVLYHARPRRSRGRTPC